MEELKACQSFKRFTHTYEDGKAWMPAAGITFMGEGELAGAPIDRLALYESLLQMEPAEAALKLRRAAPENKALTLKEMQSIQEPTRLWIVDLWGEMIPHYELVGWEVLRACPLIKKLHCVSLDGGDDFIDLDSYGRTWLAYARKPEKPHE